MAYLLFLHFQIISGKLVNIVGLRAQFWVQRGIREREDAISVQEKAVANSKTGGGGS